MSKKLTREMVEKMVLQTMNESKEVNEIFGAIKNWAMGSKPTTTPFGRKPTLPKSGKAENDAVQLLRMIASDPKVPTSVKTQISDFLSYEPSTPEMATDTSWDEEELPSANVMALGSKEEEPTIKLPSSVPTAKGVGFSGERPTTKIPGVGKPTSKMNSPLRRKVAEGNQFEALVAEVLKEMSKKQPAKEPKKPVKK